MAQLSGVSSWYWPNPGTEANVALQYVLHPVKQLTCCDGISGNCCDKLFPDLCLCEDLVTQRDFINCLGSAPLKLRISRISFQQKDLIFSYQIQECRGPLVPEVVQGTSHSDSFPASSVLILGENDVF